MVFDAAPPPSPPLYATLAEAEARIHELEAQLSECMGAEMARQQMLTLLTQMRQERDARPTQPRLGPSRKQQHAAAVDLFNESSDMSRQQASLVAEGLWDVSAYASVVNSPRFAQDSAALLRRVTELERENAAIDSKRLEAEADAQTQKTNYLDLLGHIDAAEHINFLSAPQRVPAEFQGYTPSELLPALVDAYETQAAARVVLEASVTRLQRELKEMSDAYDTLKQEVDLKDEVAASHDGILEVLHTRIDNLSATQERVMQDNATLQAALATHVRQLDRATHLAKEKEKERSDAVALHDEMKTTLAETQRELEVQRENVRSLEAEKEVMVRKLGAAEKKLSESEKRWAELAQTSLQEGLDERSAQKVQRQWAELIRALNGRRTSFAAPVSHQSRTTPIPAGATGPSAAPHHRATSILSASASTGSLLVPPRSPIHMAVDHGQHQTVATSSPMQGQHAAHLSTHGAAERSTSQLAPLPAAHSGGTLDQSQQRSTPVNLSPDMSHEHLFAATHPTTATGPHIQPLPLSVPASKQSSPDPPAERYARTAVALPPGRTFKGAGPGRPPMLASATLAAIAHLPRPKTRLRDKSVLEQALMTRAERARQAVLAKATSMPKKRAPAPPPTSLKDIL